MASLGELFVTVGANVAGFKQAMSDVKGEAEGASEAINQKILGAVSALGAASVAAALALDDAFDKIRIGTGSTGDNLSGLEDSFRNLYGSLPSTSEQIATAIADLNTRLGVTGPLLESLSTQVLNLARITGVDLNGVIRESTRFFGDWGIATDRQGDALDYIFRTSQTTGIAVDELMRLLVQFGSPLRQMGFDWETAAAMVGKFEQEGVNTELVLGSLRIGLTRMAKEGITDTNAALAALVEQIKSAGSTGEANRIAIEAFGAKAGPDMAAAIREGRFELDQLLLQLQSGPETIDKAAKATDGFKEQLALLRNQTTLVLEPLGVGLVTAMERVFSALQPLTDAFIKGRGELQKWPEAMKEAVVSGNPLAAALMGIKVQTVETTMKANAFEKALKAMRGEADKATSSQKKLPPPVKDTAGAMDKAKEAAKELASAYSKLGLKDLGKEAASLRAAIDTLKKSGDWQKLTAEQQAAATAKLNDATLAAKGYAYNWQQALIGLTTQQDSTKRSTQAMFDEMERVGRGVQNVSQDIRNMPMGMINEELMKQAEAAMKAAGEIYALEKAYNSADLKNKNAIYEMLRDQIKAAEEAGETVPREQRDMLKKMAEDLGREDGLGRVKKGWQDFSNEVSTIITNFSQDIAKSLWEGDMSWGEKGIKLLKDLGAAVTSAFIQPAVAAITGFVTDTLNGLLGGALDGIASKWGKIIGGGAASGAAGAAGDAAGAAGSIGGAAGSAGSAGSSAGSAASGAMGAVNVISGVVGAVSSVIGNFQMSAMNENLQLIEESVRWTKIDIHNLLPKLTNDFASALPAIADRLRELREIGIAVWPKEGYEKFFGGGGVTVNIEGNAIGNQEFVREMASLVAAELALQGAV